jgi:class 3 adenylate cyclase
MEARTTLPEDPELRELAEVLADSGASAEIFDSKWRVRWIGAEQCLILGIPPERAEDYYGMSPVAREARHPEAWASDRDSRRKWWRIVGPVMRYDVAPGDPEFEEVFDHLAPRVRELEPVEPPPLFTAVNSFPELAGMRESWLGDVHFLFVRVRRSDGSLLATVALSGPGAGTSLIARLTRGTIAMYQRMDTLREPSRRSAAILFADLEASGALSRQLSSRAYFELIRSLTDLIDGEVQGRAGILGKHAGDGASALFVPEANGDEAKAARAAIETARAIRAGASSLVEAGPEIRVNIGIHWGSTLTIGQVSTRGRLEVTALGDEMNEAARIESVAGGGAALASKALLERLGDADAAALDLDLDALTYTTIGELATEGKVLRDAATIAVTEI